LNDLREIAKRNAILQRRYELNYFPKVKKAIQKRISSLIEVINRDGVDAGIKFMSTQVHSRDLPAVIEDLYLRVGIRFAKLQYSQNRQEKGFGFNAAWVRFIKDYLFKFLLDKITFRVSETTREVLLNVLNKSIAEGWGISETVRQLEELPLSANQAARIVRTEVTRAANTGSMAGASTFEFEQVKEWIAARDFRTRGTDPEDHASHIGLDGQIVDYNEPFIDPRNKDRLMFPGDPNAKAESTINCRCSIGIVAKRDERGRLIPKKI